MLHSLFLFYLTHFKAIWDALERGGYNKTLAVLKALPRSKNAVKIGNKKDTKGIASCK